jgi:enamine deaminase RidA (YjgF/YER057c/UK114 family)
MPISDVIIPDGFQETYDRWQYAAATRAGDFLFISGVIGVSKDGVCPEDPAEQFTCAFEDIQRTLKVAGGSLADIVEITSYHLDWLHTRDAFVATKAKYIMEPYPAWTAIGVAQLGLPAALVEIRVTAWLGK